jgi:hypothetical protein
MDILKPPSRFLQCRFALRTGGWLMFVLAAGGLFLSVVAAQSYRSSEDEVKAALLFNLTKFVKWPDSSFDDAQAPIMFGILGGNAWVGFHLRRIAAAEKGQGRSVVIRSERFGDDLRQCHVLFVSAAERRHVPQILASLQAANVLTVSDLEGFADAGGVMQVVIIKDRARFIVNLDAATQSKLRLSAKLLALAQLIKHNQAAR